MNKKLLTLGLLLQSVCLQSVVTADPIDELPEGLPTGDVVYLGDNQFSSELLGNFEADTSNDKRYIHSVLGPLYWEFDNETELVTLETEWWGPLSTHVPGVSAENKSASGLGFEWPYVKSDITDSVYYVNVSADTEDPESTPFYNHRQINGQDIGWQHSIGIDLFSAENYFKAGETIVVQMQQASASLVALQQEYIDLSVSIAAGQGPIDEKYQQIYAQFLAIHDLFTKFVFYYHRAALAPVWAERYEMDQDFINLQYAYANQLPNLENTADNIFDNSQEILYVNAESLKTQKTNQLNTLIQKAAEEAARQQAASSGSSSSGSSSSGSSSSGSSSSASGSKFSGSGSMFDGVSVTTLVEDSLLGSTKADAQYGGTVTSTGYKNGRGSNHLLYRFGEIREGYVEFQVSGVHHDDFATKSNGAFLMIYDARGQPEPLPYYGGFRNNHFRLALKYRQDRRALKAKAITVPESYRSKSEAYLNISKLHDHPSAWVYEPTGDGFTFNDRSRWYTMRFEWKDKNIRWLVNNNVVWSGVSPYDYAPVQTRVRLGSGEGFHLQTSPNIKYRNLKVCKYK